MTSAGERPWAASDESSDDETKGAVFLYDARDNLIAELTPDQADALATELHDVAGYSR